MKRFWQITCPDKIDWDAINAIDYPKLWQEIDENNNDGYLTSAHFIELRKIQEQFRYRDNLERFIDQLEYDLTEKNNKLIYADYQAWCEETGEKPKSKNAMTRFVSTHGYMDVKRFDRGATVHYYEKRVAQ